MQQIRGYVEGNAAYKSFNPNGVQFPGKPYRVHTFSLDEPSDFEIEHDSSSNDAQSGGNATARLSASTAYRLADDRKIGPSTGKGTKSPARASYALVFEFDVLDENGKRKIITIREPVEIASVRLSSLLNRL